MSDIKKYLVTGGAGFIGSNFVKYLLARYGENVRIVVLDALTYAGNLLTIADDVARENVEFVKGDIRDRETVERLMRDFDPDYVINFAAESHVDRSITGPRVFLDTNILGAHNMLECARVAWQTGMDGAGKPCYRDGKLFVQISTDEVYGSLEEDGGYFYETTPYAPHSPYSASKASSDMLVKSYMDTYHFPANITNCSNNYGPYQFPEKLIPLIINNALHGKKLPVYGDGKNVRDWIHTEDHSSAVWAILTQGELGETYLIGADGERNNIDVLHAILEGMGQGPDDFDWVRDRPGHDRRYAIDSSKLRRELGWQPKHTDFAEGLSATIDWYRDNENWWRADKEATEAKYAARGQ